MRHSGPVRPVSVFIRMPCIPAAPVRAGCCAVYPFCRPSRRAGRSRTVEHEPCACKCKSRIHCTILSFWRAGHASRRRRVSSAPASTICPLSGLPRGRAHPFHGRSHCTASIASFRCCSCSSPLSQWVCHLSASLYLNTECAPDSCRGRPFLPCPEEHFPTHPLYLSKKYCCQREGENLQIVGAAPIYCP